MKKKIVTLSLIIASTILYAQDFTKYAPTTLKKEHNEGGTKLKHIAPAKMIIYEVDGNKDSFYFDKEGKLKAVSSKKFSYKVAEKTFQENVNGAKGEKKAPTPEFISSIKSKLDKALNLLKK